MPTYDFVCPTRHEFERFFRKISDAPTELPCPECGAIATRKVSGGAGLVFKGSGFYITDYGKDGKKPQGAPARKDESASSTKPSADAGTTAGGDTAKGSEKRSEKSGGTSGPKSSSSGSSDTE